MLSFEYANFAQVVLVKSGYRRVDALSNPGVRDLVAPLKSTTGTEDNRLSLLLS